MGNEEYDNQWLVVSGVNRFLREYYNPFYNQKYNL
jgi:hypothetical protein